MKFLKLKRKGFTLIELVMTIVMTSIIAVPLSLLITQHMESIFQSKDHTLALNLARFEMERVNNLSYANVVSANSPNYQGYDFDITRVVVYAQGSALTAESLKQIMVQATKHGSATVLVSLTTYIARNVAYGI